MGTEKVNGNFVLVKKVWMMVLIGTWLFGMGVSYAMIKTHVESNTTSIETNVECIDDNKNKLKDSTMQMNEISYNLKSICRHLEIEYIE